MLDRLIVADHIEGRDDGYIVDQVLEHLTKALEGETLAKVAEQQPGNDHRSGATNIFCELRVHMRVEGERHEEESGVELLNAACVGLFGCFRAPRIHGSSRC